MKSVSFPCEQSPTPFGLGHSAADWATKLGAPFCRNVVLEGAGIGSVCLALEKARHFLPDEDGLAGLMAGAYADMARRTTFLGAGSAVPFCFSANPQGGHYFLHVPRGADPSTPVLMLIHGYGGNLLYFPWAIWKEAPDCILIAPSWQIDWSDGPFAHRRDYIETALAHAADRSGFRLSKPWLVPLSQGGPTAFALAADSPQKWRGVLGISTFGDGTPRSVPVRLLHGSNDARIALRSPEAAVSRIRSAGGDACLNVVDGGNHFLLLSHRKELGEWLRRCL